MNAQILVFEDEDILRNALVDRLRQEGFEVHSASNGQRGLKLFQERSGDLVITDVLMPEIDGLEVIRTLRRLPTSPLILAMSGGGSRDLDFLIEAKEFGADEVLNKPFQLEDFIETVKRLLARNSPSGRTTSWVSF